MFARLYNVAWSRTGRDRPVLPMATIKTKLDAAGAATSAARTDFRYIKRGVLQLPGVASDQDYRANYLIYSNDDSHYFGAWIDSIEWASAGSFAVTFTDDLFTTFAAGATVEGYRKRACIRNWALAHQPTVVGDFNAIGWEIVTTWQATFSEQVPTFLFYLLPAVSNPNTYAYSRVPSGAFIAVATDNNDLLNILTMLQSPSFNFDSLIACYVVPAGLIGANMLENKTYQWATSSGASATFKTFKNVGTPMALSNTDPATDVNLSVADTYAALLNDHDCQIRIRLGESTHMIRPSDLASFNFVVEYGFKPTPFMTITPRWNGNYLTPSFGFSSFPQAPISADSFNAWLRNVAIPSTIGIIGGAINVGVGNVDGGRSIGEGIGEQLRSSMFGYSISDYSQGRADPVSAAGKSFVGVDVLIPKNWAEALHYYAEFGFPTQGRASFTLSPTGANVAFDFYQSTDNIITGNMPAAAKDEIDAALKAGVRCWNTIGIGDYT